MHLKLNNGWCCQVNDTLYLIIVGALSTVAGWLIINAIKFIYKLVKGFIDDIKQIKTDVSELKSKVKNLEDKLGDKDE